MSTLNNKGTMGKFLKKLFKNHPDGEDFSEQATVKSIVADVDLPMPQPIRADTSSVAVPTETQPELTAHKMVVCEELQKILSDLVAELNNCKLAAYIDMRTNRLLGMVSAVVLPDHIQTLLAAATADLFYGGNVVKVADVLREQQDDIPIETPFNSISVRSKNETFVFMRSKQYQDRVAVVSCTNIVSFGWVRLELMKVVEKIDQLDLDIKIR